MLVLKLNYLKSNNVLRRMLQSDSFLTGVYLQFFFSSDILALILDMSSRQKQLFTHINASCINWTRRKIF